MILRVAVVSLAVLCAATSGFGQQNTVKQWKWATDMFEYNGGTLRHDFGTVARGAKALYRFKFTNLFEEDCHVMGVRASCQCTTPQIAKADLKTWEVGEIIAEVNTRAFLGDKTATITVTFDKPYHAEVQLVVSAQIRSDVVVLPGEVNLGTVDLGAGAQKTIQVTYAGRETWNLEQIRSANDNLEATIAETSRARGRVSYDVTVKLKKEAPAGLLSDQIFLVTNDPATNNLPVSVEGNVVSDISVSPESMFFGVVHPGKQVPKKLIVSGKTAFRITDIKCKDDSFQFTPSTKSDRYHIVPIVFTARDKPGKVTRTIVIQTDQGAKVEITAYAQVVGDESPKAAHQQKSTKTTVVDEEAKPAPAPKPKGKNAIPKIGPVDDDEDAGK